MSYLSLLNACSSSTPYALNVVAVTNTFPAKPLPPPDAPPPPGFPGGPLPGSSLDGRPPPPPIIPLQGCFPSNYSSPATTYSYFVTDGSKITRYNTCNDPGCSIVCQRSDTAVTEKSGCDLYSFTAVNSSSTTITGRKLRVSFFPDSACNSAPLYFYDVPYNPNCTKGAQGNYTLSKINGQLMNNLECLDSACQTCSNQALTWPTTDTCTLQSNVWGVYYSKSSLIVPAVAETPIASADSQQNSSSSVNVGLISGLAVAGFLIIAGAIGLILFYRRRKVKLFPERKTDKTDGTIHTEFVPEMDRETFLLYLNHGDGQR